MSVPSELAMVSQPGEDENSGRFAGKTGGWMPKNADVSFEFPFSSFEDPLKDQSKKPEHDGSGLRGVANAA
jgi:hypothetical protein